MPADQDPSSDGGRPSRRRPAPAAASGTPPPLALADVAHEPGAPKPDPILVADGIVRQFGGLTAVDVEHVEIQRGAITALIGPNGAGKTTFFNLLTGFDQPDQGTWSFGGRSLYGVAAHKVARMGMVRTFQLTKALSKLTVIENMRLGATGQKGENVFRALFQAHLGRPGARDHRAGRRPARPLQARRQARGLRRQPVRRPAQAARDGPGPDGRPGDGHARRADGRGEPGADPVAARPREGPARGRHDRAVRRARHGHGPRHLGLGHRDGAGQGHRRGSAGRRDGRPARHRRLPGLAPRRRPHRGGRAEGPRRGRGSTRARAGRERGAASEHAGSPAPTSRRDAAGTRSSGTPVEAAEGAPRTARDLPRGPQRARGGRARTRCCAPTRWSPATSPASTSSTAATST